ncbi:Ca2+-binding RTX toxin-like protein [Mycoplana sp. BE70]|uniref:type I secretion C-terminal target domain-containing protein n=1 Tax=Mycoplana sp. BE70 TaxID=2817775 RepID=UPI0028547E3C|nr:type I secretion C-terminal target domain-containing protein [Mycoplana sp. BE70]MDR6754987.1 Ca2+-binding RTX toxin-like protein [Mycoplana sp. BE70]
MALRGIGANLIGSGVQVNLGTTDSAYVAANVLVSSSDSTAIQGFGSWRTVYVDGTLAAAVDAISLGGSPATDHDQHVVIGQTGNIKSFGTTGIWIYGFNSIVENYGKIWSDYDGVYMNGDSTTTTSRLVNSGTIEAANWAIWHGSDATETLVITNSGMIKGGQYAIYSSSDATPSIEKITNTGKIIGNMALKTGNDVYDGTGGRLTGTIFAGAGHDTLRGGIDNDRFNGDAGNDKLYGGKGNDTLKGDAGNDLLQGDDGNDVLVGGDGNDTLYGGLGKDTLTGGAGKDMFVFKSLRDSTINSLGRDVIKDFSRAEGDKIDLKGIDANAKASGDQAFIFIDKQAFHKTAGELRYEIKSGDTYIHGDTNGDGKADFSILLDLSLAMKASDFIL